MPGLYIALLCLAVAAVFFLTLRVRQILSRRAVPDHSSHCLSDTILTPDSGGLAVVSVLVSVGLFSFIMMPEPPLSATVMLLLAAVLMFSSWSDAVRPLPFRIRFCVQMVAAIIGLSLLSPEAVFQGTLPFWLAAGLSFFLWIWFINLFSGMDGIDGIAGVETICICTGLSLIAYSLQDWHTAWMPLLIAACTIGFLVHNWYPSRIRLGKVGNIPLGFLLGGLLLEAAGRGYWVEALVLPAYYMADATLTLLYRLLRREKIGLAHSEHYYQKAAMTLGRHDVVCLVILAANALLIASMSAATFFHAPQTALVCGALVIFGALRTLYRLAQHAPPTGTGNGS